MTIPVTTHSVPDWIRRAAAAINKLTAENEKPVRTFAGVVFEPTAEPAAPVAGQTYFDSTSDTLRCWDGAAWQNLF